MPDIKDCFNNNSWFFFVFITAKEGVEGWSNSFCCVRIAETSLLSV